MTEQARRRLSANVATMFDEPEESPAEKPAAPAQRAREKADELRTHAELAAVFEGCRKFDAVLRVDLDPEPRRAAQVPRQLVRLDGPELDDLVSTTTRHAPRTDHEADLVEREVGGVEEEHLPWLGLDRVER